MGLIAAGLVFKLGVDAWQESYSSEENSEEDDETNTSFYGKLVSLITVSTPKIFQDAFKGFGVNCTDDIAVNTANIIGKDWMETSWYLLGNIFGVISTIIGAWILYGALQYFAERYARWFHRVRACGIWFASFLIIRSSFAI